MKLIDHGAQSSTDWRPGVRTTMLLSAENGAAQLCIFDQFCAPGLGAPTHLHAVEEVLTIIDGEAEISVGGERRIAKGGASVLIPAGHWHGFRNVGNTTLHVRATLAAPVFEASYEDRNELSRRFLPPDAHER